jgi:SAM-dependent methyltransferase
MKTMWDKRYSEPGYAYGTDPNEFLASSLSHLKPGGTVLCLAEGEGRNSVFLAEKGYQVTAIDNSAVGLQKAEQLAADRGVEITTHLADLADYQLPLNSFDAIISIFCHLPPDIRANLHKQIYGSLKKGGTFLLEGYTPEQLKLGTGGPPQLQLLMEIEDLKTELHQLNFLLAREIKREINEGALHTGFGAVAQLIATKK